ncbi:hypothetical protein SDC9_194217 [bioreactor metagenome]|uniref:Uncharacterized protein n=1 Tax=bioreactor metagenome TaxID=1076179 RepID=A0A645I6V0_9ZZZZ
MRKQIELLEHHAHALAVHVYIDLFIGYVNAFEYYLARRRLLKQVQAAQECALARTGRAYDNDNLALFNFHVYAVHGFELSKRLLKVNCPNQFFTVHFF